MNLLQLFAAILVVFVSSAHGSPFFDLLFGNPQEGRRSNYGRRPKGRTFTSGGGYNEYKRICRTLNPDPYAHIGSNPYPAAPFCPP